MNSYSRQAAEKAAENGLTVGRWANLSSQGDDSLVVGAALDQLDPVSNLRAMAIHHATRNNRLEGFFGAPVAALMMDDIQLALVIVLRLYREDMDVPAVRRYLRPSLGVSANRARSALRLLIRLGLVTRPSRGVYRALSVVKTVIEGHEY